MSESDSNVGDQLSAGEDLYHYTTLDALLSILKNNCLWASDLESMNDPAELAHIFELGKRFCLGESISLNSTGSGIWKVLDLPVQARSTPSDDNLAWGYQHFIAGIVQRFERPGTTDAWKSALGRVFGTSFCRKGDLLSQWRGYGLTGNGVSISFDQKQLADDFGPSCKLAIIEYNSEAQISRIRSFIEHAFSGYCKTMDGVPIGFTWREDGPDDIAIDTGFKSFLDSMARIAHTFKRLGFSEEEEYRLIKTVLKESELNEVEVRARGNSLVPYVSLQLRRGKLPIKEIIHGPAYESDSAKYALVALLKQKGYPDVKISRSKYSLR